MKTGAAFGDHIKKESFSRRKNYSGEDIFLGNTMRPLLFPIIMVLAGILLVGKLFFLQVISGSYYRSISDKNRIRTSIIYAPRGVIFDRNGKSLVYNMPGFRETLFGQTRFINQKQALELLAHTNNHLEIDSLRNYPYKDAMAHVLGYIGQISKEELSDASYSGYRGGDIIGKMGLEQEYEDKLRGINGKRLSEVDANGKIVRTLGQTDPVSGQNLTLTLDASLQQAAFNAMKDIKKGIAIVSTPKGEILTMVSKPSFDPNIFTQPDYQVASESGYKNSLSIVMDNNNQPLLNRTISGIYPPGSTFKLVVAVSALENKLIDENYSILDTGIIHVGTFSFANWYYSDYGKTDGDVNVVKGITRSNDIFFYKVGELVGVDKISKTARQFGLGSILGIDLPGEARGLVPTKEWKEKYIGESWYLGDDYHYAIGQGYLLVTPLQVNGWTQAIANNGTFYQPHLLQSQMVNIKSQNLLKNKNVNLIREGMIGSCQPGGEAWPLYGFKVKNSKLIIDGKNFLAVSQATGSAQVKDEVGVSIACKTGSAQHGNDNEPPHGWITLFAPAYNPQVIVTVLAETSGMGSNVAAPVAKDILTAWFSEK